jgi:serine/threonine protein kinase
MSATRPIGVDGEDAVKRQLEALANGECDHVAFLEAMKERFRFEPDENWEALSLLDQYYRRGKIPLDVYRAIKNGFAEYILGPQVAMPTLNKVAAPVPAAPPATAAAPSSPPPTQAAAAASAAPAAPAATAPPTAAQAAAPAAPPAARATPAAPKSSAAPAPSPAAQAAPAKVHPAAVTPPELTPAPTFTGTPAPSFTGSLAPAFTGSATQAAAANARASAAPPREVGVEDVLRDRYRIESVVARGGSCTVYEVSDAFRLNLPPAGKRLALKVPRTPDPRGNFLSQLRHEFHQLQHLSHPNIVRACDFDRDGALSFFTMELLSGVHLPQVLQAKGAQALPRAHALAIIQALGSAIAYAHSRSVVHGDINPQNVFITMAGEIRLLGFGAAHKLSAAVPTPEFERASASSDTHRYASCEVFEGNRPTVHDDIYSLSCLAYLLLKGRHPYADSTSIEARATRLRPRRPAGLSYQQWRTLRAGLSTDANKRPDSAQDWLDGMALGVAPPPRLPAANELIEARADKPRRLTWLAAAVVIAALIGGLGYWYSMSGGTFPLSPLSREPANEDLAAPDTSEPPTMATVPTTTAPTAPAATTSPPPVSATPPAVTQQRPSAAASQPAMKPTTPSTQRPAAAPSALSAPAAAPASSATGTTATGSTATGNGVGATASAAASATSSTARAGGVPRVEMAVDTLDAAPTDTAVHVTVRRKGNLHGVTSFTWWTESGTAKPGVDFSPVLPHVAQMQDGEASMDLTVPLISTVRAQPKGFYVGIESTDGGAQIGARALTQITLPPTN